MKLVELRNIHKKDHLADLSASAEKLSERGARSRAEVLLRLLGLGERMDHEPSQLSGGQQQRVVFARALVNQPPVSSADEPTGNPDSRTSEEVLTMFRELNEGREITIILVPHDVNVALHAEGTIRIHDGVIIDGGLPAVEESPVGEARPARVLAGAS